MSQYSLFVGDCLEGLRELPDGAARTCVTSPPYFGLRDYGVDGQIGLEQSPDEFVAALVEVFREVRRVLRDDGTLWLNLGDSYSATILSNNNTPNANRDGSSDASSRAIAAGLNGRRVEPGLPPKNLLGIPWRVAFALQADGWYLRQDIVWHKPNPMPESVRDRCTKSHEYIFLLSKSPRYYFDAEAIAEPVTRGAAGSFFTSGKTAEHQLGRSSALDRIEKESRNKRSVWTVTTKPFKGAHFAVFPPDLIEPCVLAGSAQGDMVIDPFTGSGTTGMVAGAHGRRFYGCELNPEYAAMANERITQAYAQQRLFA